MSQENLAHHLVGEVLTPNLSGEGWTVEEKFIPAVDRTPGFFSVGYRVRSDSGRPGFLKALDFTAALGGADPATQLAFMTSTFNAERELLMQCGSSRLTKVVTALASGVHIGVNQSGTSETVQYLILEMADGDARDLLKTNDEINQIQMLRLAHNCAVGMSQLHSIKASHQDLKPANVLYWNESKSLNGKLGDLGRAHSEDRTAPHDDAIIPGDASHASPEYLYGVRERLSIDKRRYAADYYMLGNLICFLMSGASFNSIMFDKLPLALRPGNHVGDFDDVLPALLNAHAETLRDLSNLVITPFSSEVKKIIGELCYPDPKRRGDQQAINQERNPFSLNRIISNLDRLHRKAASSLGRF